MPEKGKPTSSPPVDKKAAMGLYRTMFRIRRVEETLVEVFNAGELPGFLHTCIGQEATPAGVCHHLRSSDYITTSHRGHGHALAKGVDLRSFMAELYGKSVGLCRGRSGSIHLADEGNGMIGANGIVGGGIPLATGAAFSAQYQKNGRVAVSFFGEAATDQGVFHESLNMASLWKLPIVYVCENNGWAQFTPQSKHMVLPQVSDKAAAYGMEGITVANDVLKIEAAANRALEKARRGGGPTLLEVTSSRWNGHYVGDPQAYRDQDDVVRAQENDCLERFKTRIIGLKRVKQEALIEVEQRVESEIAEAVEYARASPVADSSDLMAGLYLK